MVDQIIDDLKTRGHLLDADDTEKLHKLITVMLDSAERRNMEPERDPHIPRLFVMTKAMMMRRANTKA